MFLQPIALVSETDKVGASELARVAAAIQQQVTRDLAPVWGVAGSVAAFPALEDVPFDYWPIVVAAGPRPDAAFGRDAGAQPYARLSWSRDWSVLASRACLELLVNPYGARTLKARSPRESQGAVGLLVEVSAPCAGARHAYAIDDVPVSDFCTPAYYALGVSSRAERSSFAGSLGAPLQIREGGHLTWYDPLSGRWWLRNYWGEHPVDTDLGRLESGSAGPRELLQQRLPASSSPRPLSAFTAQAQQRVLRQRALAAAQQRSAHLREQLRADAERERQHELAADEGSVAPRGAWTDREEGALELVIDEREAEVSDASGEVELGAPAPEPARARARSTPVRPAAGAVSTLRVLGEVDAIPMRSRASALPLALALCAAAVGLVWLGRSLVPARTQAIQVAAPAPVAAPAKPAPESPPGHESVPPSAPALAAPPTAVSAVAAQPQATAAETPHPRARPRTARLAEGERAGARAAAETAAAPSPFADAPQPSVGQAPGDSIQDLFRSRE
jgi:hypothetical protein